MGFLPANFQLATLFHSRLRVRHVTDRQTDGQTTATSALCPPWARGHNLAHSVIHSIQTVVYTLCDDDWLFMSRPRRAEALNVDDCLASVSLSRLFVAYIGPKSRTERPRKTKIGTEVAHVTRDSDTTFKVKRTKFNLQGAEAYCGGLPHSLLSDFLCSNEYFVL